MNLKISPLPYGLTIGRVPRESASSPAFAGFHASAVHKCAKEDKFFSLTLTRDEISLVFPTEKEDDSEESSSSLFSDLSPGWRAFRVVGQLDFALVGILSRLSGVLASAGVSLFAVSTFDTDYVLVKEEQWEKCLQVLDENGIKQEL